MKVAEIHQRWCRSSGYPWEGQDDGGWGALWDAGVAEILLSVLVAGMCSLSQLFVPLSVRTLHINKKVLTKSPGNLNLSRKPESQSETPFSLLCCITVHLYCIIVYAVVLTAA